MTRFKVDDEYVSKYEVHVVGDVYHQELWIPAEKLEEFNLHIIGKIEFISEFTQER